MNNDRIQKNPARLISRTRITKYMLIGALLFAAANLAAYCIRLFNAGELFNDTSEYAIERGLITGMLILNFVVSLILMFEHATTRRFQQDQLNWAVAQLHKLSAAEVADEEQAPSQESPQRVWPWGTYHNSALGHLEAAANRYWKLYDPTLPDTAPTNLVVETWLQEERGVSKEMAKRIATILRADGLKTGPR